MKDLRVSLDRLHEFDQIIDARTPLEFAEDHIPGAINAPVLSNEERVIVGTLYSTSPFEATRLGAAMVAKNIGYHLDTLFVDRPRHWRPLVYCWRGGKRSGSMTTWFDLIGWRAKQLEGGYKGYRHAVLETLNVRAKQFSYIVLMGPTGSGKTRLLQALGKAGAQILDLEQLAAHRGSLLGALPNMPQPSQKAFDTALAGVLTKLDPVRPVFIEAESRKIGTVTLPDALIDGMRRAACVMVQADRKARLAFLLDDYRHLFSAPDTFKSQLERLIGLHSKETVAQWHAWIDSDERARLFEDLMLRHYDPAYARSGASHFVGRIQALPFAFDPTADNCIAQAGRLLRQLA